MSCGLGSPSRPLVEFLSHEWLLTLGTPLVDPGNVKPLLPPRQRCHGGGRPRTGYSWRCYKSRTGETDVGDVQSACARDRLRPQYDDCRGSRTERQELAVGRGGAGPVAAD